MEEEGDKEKIVEMTVYPETGYTGYLMSDNTFGEFLVISDSDDKEKGYTYTLNIKKVIQAEPYSVLLQNGLKNTIPQLWDPIRLK